MREGIGNYGSEELYKAPSIRPLRKTPTSKIQSLHLIHQTLDKHRQNALQVHFPTSGSGCLCLCPGQCFANDRQYRPDHPEVIGNQRYRQEHIHHKLLQHWPCMLRSPVYVSRRAAGIRPFVLTSSLAIDQRL